jgi:hypothetical protein
MFFQALTIMYVFLTILLWIGYDAAYRSLAMAIPLITHQRSLSMRKFLVGLFIVLLLSGISLAIISCVTDGGTGTSSSQHSQPQKAPTKGG